MTDCIYFQQIIKELNPSDSNTGDCCSWSMVSCDGDKITKLDFSNYKGITKDNIPQTIQFLTNLKEFSIHGQSSIKEIYSLPTANLEKVDLSNSGLSSSSFPTWILDAENIKDLDISNTQITGMPQREIKSNIKNCNFSNTPICGTYQSSPYANYIPDNCKSTCSGGYTGPSSSNNKQNSEGGTKVWPFILIGIVVLAILGGLGYLYMKRSKKDDKLSNYDSPRPILPVSKKDNKEIETESLEISVDENTPAFQKNQEVVTVPPAAVINHAQNEDKIEEIARNNYNAAYGAEVKQNVINNNRVSNVSEQDQSFYPHPSIYNTMTTDNDSDDEVDINKPIINESELKEEKERLQEQPVLLRRKSSKKANAKTNEAQVAEEPKQESDDLYIANWDYAPTLSDELALVAGDVIEIKKKFDDGWSTGYNRRTKQTGIVPLCYLKEYED